MIQRQQTLWLLLSAVAAFFSFQYPFYTGNITEETNTLYKELDGGSDPFILIITGALLLLAAITIFLYKDRKTQLTLTITGIVLSIGLIALYFAQTSKFIEGRFSLTSILTLLIAIGFIFAARGIWRDQKLVKSLNKLR